jgi:hypothetical protein
MTDRLSIGLDLLFSAFNLSYSDGVLFFVLVIAFIMSIQDYRIGFISLLLFSTLAYILFTILNWPTLHATIILFISIVLLAFSLFINNNGGKVYTV